MRALKTLRFHFLFFFILGDYYPVLTLFFSQFLLKSYYWPIFNQFLPIFNQFLPNDGSIWMILTPNSSFYFSLSLYFLFWFCILTVYFLFWLFPPALFIYFFSFVYISTFFSFLLILFIVFGLLYTYIFFLSFLLILLRVLWPLSSIVFLFCVF